MKKSKKIQLALVLYLTVFYGASLAQHQSRKNLNIPDVLGYKSLKCDFHTHTVFSDGNVWPTFLVEEAWHDGLDVIAITDHLEYQPKKEFIKSNHNAAFQIAKNLVEDLGITLIQGAEITRSMPPGHINALFVKDGNALVKDNWKDAISEAKNQDALLFWNHPSWINQQPDGIAKWYQEHDWIFQTGILFGLEVYNENVYSPEAHQWCIDKKLAMLGNSDAHSPIVNECEIQNVQHRTVTLVFAKDQSPEAVREALLAQRSVIWSENILTGDERFLKEIFNKSVSLSSDKVIAKGREYKSLLFTNKSDVAYNLKLISGHPNIQFPREVNILPNRTTRIRIRAAKDNLSIKEKVKIVYEINNLVTAPGKTLQSSMELDINILPKN